MSRQLTKLVNILFITLLGFSALAQSPTPQQLEQFKKLPRAQQEQLARQMGVNLSDLKRLSSRNSLEEEGEQSNTKTYPRGTLFDEFGNPLSEEDSNMFGEKEGTDELKLYGLELFANSPSTFSPVSDVPVPANYLVGPGDELSVRLFGKENEDYNLTVNQDGNIIIPKLGPFNVASMSFSEVKSYISEQIKQRVIGVEVSVSMGELRTMRVFVMGEAHKPGAYNVSSLSTITHALFVSGGISDIASLRNIQLKRSGKLIATLDLYDLLNAGDSSNDLLLQSGDVVFIPPVERTVTIAGEVRRPAIYELKNEHSLQNVLKLAGGSLPEGYKEAISIRRYIDGARMQLTASLDDPSVVVKNGDYVKVPKVSSFVSNSVTLIGAVARPGKYQWHEEMKISQLIGEPRKDLLDAADLTYVIVLRDKNSNRDIEVIQTDLTRLAENSAEFDVVLQNNDRILVFSKVESEQIGEINLDDLAFTSEEIEAQEKEAWQQRIQEKLFWESIGLKSTEDQNQRRDYDDEQNIQTSTIVELSIEESERVLEYKDTTYFSRKRMLAPVIAKLRDQARFGHPLQLVEVAGEVKVPGIYPLSVNANVKNMIVAAGGLTEASYPFKSEITRTLVNDKGINTIEHIEFSPIDIFGSKGTQFRKIESKDRINVFSLPSWQEELIVEIKGEIEFPGKYTIRRGETLSDLLKRAGGLTEYGNVDAVIFTRESLREQERKNLQNLAQELRKQIASESLRRNSNAGSIVSYDESRKLLRDLSSVDAIGRLVIDFGQVVAGVKSADIDLEDGDVLYVPGRSQSVNVIGEVYVPTSHLYEASVSFEEYITRSGGFRTLADQENTYIIRANGSVTVPGRSDGFWFSENSEEIIIRPGDTIVVPFDADNVDNMTLWTNATQILYQLAVAIAAIGSL